PAPNWRRTTKGPIAAGCGLGSVMPYASRQNDPGLDQAARGEGLLAGGQHTREGRRRQAGVGGVEAGRAGGPPFGLDDVGRAWLGLLDPELVEDVDRQPVDGVGHAVAAVVGADQPGAGLVMVGQVVRRIAPLGALPDRGVKT